MISQRVRELQLALMLLTRLPAGRLADPAPSFAEAAWAFPIVGAIIGLISGGISIAALALGFPPIIIALLAVASAAILTGAMHEDGLADLADGFGGGATREDKLRIMRDSQIGSYGVVALVLMVGLKVSAIAEVSVGMLLCSFVVISAASRAAMLVPMALLPAARDDGLGQKASLTLGGRFCVGIGFSALALAFWGTVGFWVALAMLASALIVTLLAKRQIGGQTGDVLGATQAVSETFGWLTLILVI